MEKITVQKKNSHTSWGGFRFRRDRILAGGIISLRCVKRNCRGRLRVDEKDNVVSSSEHTHEPESGGLKVVSEIRRKSVERQIFQQNSDTLSAYSTSDRLEKKMILIEPRQTNDYMERKTLSRSDSEILHRERQTMFKPSIVIKVKGMQESAVKESVKESDNFESMVIDTVPNTMKPRASHLLEHRASHLLKHIKLIPHI